MKKKKKREGEDKRILTKAMHWKVSSSREVGGVAWWEERGESARRKDKRWKETYEEKKKTRAFEVETRVVK